MFMTGGPEKEEKGEIMNRMYSLTGANAGKTGRLPDLRQPVNRGPMDRTARTWRCQDFRAARTDSRMRP